MAAINLTTAPPNVGQTNPEAGSATKLEKPLIIAEGLPKKASPDGLAGFIHTKFQVFKNHEDTIAFEEQCKAALRTYKGRYSPQERQEIQAFGGSDVYAHLTSTKCRGATALLRDIFLGQEQAWGLAPSKDPNLPEEIGAGISDLVSAEAHAMQEQGMAIDPGLIDDRINGLLDEAMKQAEVVARDEAKEAERYLQDILTEGGFYDALVDFITDLPIYPHAILKGPVVKRERDLRWVDGKPVTEIVPKMKWYRVSPFDLYFTPGASKIENAATIEYSKLSRAELTAMIGLKGYDEKAIRSVLTEYTDGYTEYRADDSERAFEEGREDPQFNQSGLIDCLEWQGPVPGKMLLQHGFTKKQIPDDEIDYFVNAWVIGRHVIKVQIKHDAQQRPSYYITSFEKVPGSIRGLGLPDILEDVQRMANGSLRALANNMAIASGPQVVIDETQVGPSQTSDALYPWKRWRFESDPMATSAKPAVDFFQPNSNANELLGVYQSMTNIADETSSIPRYLTGNERVGGAGRTASGLSMLMGSASKMIQVVASNIDRDIMRGVVQSLYNLVMITDGGEKLRGDEDIVIRGVEIAREKELERSRRLEFLQITANPMDSQLMGMRGRANVLRPIAEDLGLTGPEILPSDIELKQMEEMQKQQAAMQQAAMIQGNEQPGAPSNTQQADQMGNDMRALT